MVQVNNVLNIALPSTPSKMELYHFAVTDPSAFRRSLWSDVPYTARLHGGQAAFEPLHALNERTIARRDVAAVSLGRASPPTNGILLERKRTDV